MEERFLNTRNEKKKRKKKKNSWYIKFNFMDLYNPGHSKYRNAFLASGIRNHNQVNNRLKNSIFEITKKDE